jgi:hypothetical protein
VKFFVPRKGIDITSNPFLESLRGSPDGRETERKYHDCSYSDPGSRSGFKCEKGVYTEMEVALADVYRKDFPRE